MKIRFTITVLLLLFIKGISFGQEQKNKIKQGSGNFTIKGGFKNEKDSIKIFYYKPINYKPNFSVIIVVPGGGRNGDDYRDKWIDLANKYNLLVLSPSYSKTKYPKSKNYNIGRLSNSSFINKTTKKRNSNEEWIFDDFDRIFNTALADVNSTQKTYDLFGHSAGGQIAHRLALFNPKTKVNSIVAANSGWYTLPDFDTEFPYGLKDLTIKKNHLRKTFKSNLIILLGEKDNKYEKRGDLRKTKPANFQGDGRFSRGVYFFKTAEVLADKFKVKFNWKKKIVKDVGHSYSKMGVVAAEYLYSTKR
jgi:pimeloyl-ACP methyl ester carboxylesterase